MHDNSSGGCHRLRKPATWAGVLWSLSCALFAILLYASLSPAVEAGERHAEHSSSTAIPSRTMKEIKLTEADNGKTIDLPPRTELLILLPENPSTGYVWGPDMQDSEQIQLLNSEYVPGDGLAPGRGGQHAFRFALRQPGTSLLRLKRWRPWEGDKSVLERFEVTLRVRTEQ